MSATQQKRLTDAAGEHIFTMKHLGLGTSKWTIGVYGAFDTATPLLSAVQQKHIQSRLCTIRAEVHDQHSGRSTQITMKGDKNGKAAIILLGDEHSEHVMAKVYRPRTLADLLLWSQEYHATIGAGVDAAVVVALVVMWDEACFDQRHGSGVDASI